MVKIKTMKDHCASFLFSEKYHVSYDTETNEVVNAPQELIEECKRELYTIGYVLINDKVLYNSKESTIVLNVDKKDNT